MFGKTTVNSGSLQSKNSGLMGKIPGFELKPGEYYFFNVRLERISSDSIKKKIVSEPRKQKKQVLILAADGWKRSGLPGNLLTEPFQALLHFARRCLTLDG